MNKPLLSSVNNKEFITLPFVISAESLALEGEFQTEVTVPIAINDKFVILDATTIIELPEQADIPSLFETIQPSDRGNYQGFHFNLPGVFYGEVYTTDEGIVCDIFNHNQSHIEETSYVHFSELVEVGEEIEINEKDIISLNTIFAKMVELDDFSFEDNFNTIFQVAGVDIDLENDSSSALMTDLGNNEKVMGLKKIKNHIEQNNLTLLEVVTASRSNSEKAIKNLMFDPVLQFTMVVNNEEYGTIFDAFYAEEFNVDLTALMAKAYGLLATELFV